MKRIRKLHNRISSTLVVVLLVWIVGPCPGQDVVKKPKKARPTHSALTPAAFTPEMPLEEAIDIIRHTTHPPLNIVVLWKDLANNADIYRDTAIGMEGVSGVRLRTLLDLLLTAVAGGNSVKLGYTIRHGVITIRTRHTIRPKPQTRVYDVSDLVHPPANYFFPWLGLGNMAPMVGQQPIGMMGSPLGTNSQTLLPSM
jgi:hypothetical protein